MMKRGGYAKGKRSVNAIAAARVKCIAKVTRGEKVVMAPILREVGYSEAVSKNPAEVTTQPAYIEEIESYATRLEKHRSKVLLAMENKNLDEEQYRTLADASAKITHDIQLLTGGKTENIGVRRGPQNIKSNRRRYTTRRMIWPGTHRLFG